MCRGCRLLPHGGYTLFPAVLSTLAWFASLSQDGCDYVQVTGPIVDEITTIKGVPFIEMGFSAYRAPAFDPDSKGWVVSYEGECSDYNEDVINVDMYWKVSKGFAFLALVLGGGGALFLWFSSCFVFSPGTWRLAGVEVLMASIFQALAFLWFQTETCTTNDNKCELFYGSKSDILAALFWFVSGIAICCRYPTPTVSDDDDDDEDPEIVDMHEENTKVSTIDPELELPISGDADTTMVNLQPKDKDKNPSYLSSQDPEAEIL
mmetsp:Transcript_8153/g.11745  ORF Transcript_8153/g.11745 Transcript_8153/m.11745 type:complete len:263 (+) Transcript_8153:326-1114(+)